MERNERRGAGRVDCDAGPMRAEDIRNAVRQNGKRGARREMRVGDCGVAKERMTVIGLRGPDEDANVSIRD